MVKRCKFASKFIQIIWHLYLPLSFFFQSKLAALCTHSEGKSLLRAAGMHAPPRSRGKWLPRPAPSLTLTPPRPEDLSLALPRPDAKKGCSVLPCSAGPITPPAQGRIAPPLRNVFSPPAAGRKFAGKFMQWRFSAGGGAFQCVRAWNIMEILVVWNFSESQMLYTSYIFLFHDEIIQISEFNVKETATDPTDHIQFEFFSHESIRTNLMSPRLKRTHK